jgi:hypothetical protein
MLSRASIAFMVSVLSSAALTACAGRALAPSSAQPQAPKPASPQELAELDRLIHDVHTNLDATRTSAEHAEASKAKVDAQLAAFRAKLPPDRSARADQTEHREQANPNSPAQEAADPVALALAAFEARSAHADALVQLRRAQVEARAARLDRLWLERSQLAQPAVTAEASAQARAQLQAVKNKEADAKANVGRLDSAEQTADTHWHDAVKSYRAVRQDGSGAGDEPSDDAPPAEPRASR